MAAERQAALDRSNEVRKYLLVSGVRGVIAKIFARYDYVFEVA